MKSNKLYPTIIVLAVIGVLLALYLMWQQLYRPAFQPCYVNSFINCNAVISGPVSHTFGIPTPLIGFVGYVVILFAAIQRKVKLLLSMVVFGLIFCLWLGYKELFQLHVICPVCITCQLIMITIFVLSVTIAFSKPPKVE